MFSPWEAVGVNNKGDAVWPDHGLVMPQMDSFQSDTHRSAYEKALQEYLKNVSADGLRELLKPKSEIPYILNHMAVIRADEESRKQPGGRSLFPKVERRR